MEKYEKYLLENTEKNTIIGLQKKRSEIHTMFKDMDIETIVFVVSRQIFVKISNCTININTFRRKIEGIGMKITQVDKHKDMTLHSDVCF